MKRGFLKKKASTPKITQNDMILYNVTVNVDRQVHEEWLEWMRRVHIPDVMSTGLFLEYRLLRLINEVENDGFTYAIQYLLKSMDDFQLYQCQYAPSLQAEHQRLYGQYCHAFRTLLEVIS